jgi:hypothetical protein
VVSVVVFRHERRRALRLTFPALVANDDQGLEFAAVGVAEVDIIDVVDDLTSNVSFSSMTLRTSKLRRLSLTTLSTLALHFLNKVGAYSRRRH